jgi:hypothetical protein
VATALIYMDRMQKQRLAQRQVSWARDAVSAIRNIVLIENRMEVLTVQVKHLADGYTDLDRRMVRLEAKFDLIETMAVLGRRALPAKSPSPKDKKKSS